MVPRAVCSNEPLTQHRRLLQRALGGLLVAHAKGGAGQRYLSGFLLFISHWSGLYISAFQRNTTYKAPWGKFHDATLPLWERILYAHPSSSRSEYLKWNLVGRQMLAGYHLSACVHSFVEHSEANLLALMVNELCLFTACCVVLCTLTRLGRILATVSHS